METKYKSLARPPLDALRNIQAGDLKGKTDINPQWRYEAMDNAFGQCGDGWKYEIVKLWDRPTQDGTILCFAQVNIYTKIGDKWSDPVPGVGGNTLVDMVKGYNPSDPKRAKPNDEGYKMAITDAIGTALKMIGVAADIYRGNFDGSKYRDLPEQKKPAEQKKAPDDAEKARRAALAKRYTELLNTADDTGQQVYDETWKAKWNARLKEAGYTVTIKEIESDLGGNK